MSIEEAEDIEIEVSGSETNEGVEDQEVEGAEMDDVDEEGMESEFVAVTGKYNAETINEEVFDELHLSADVAEEVQKLWRAFVATFDTPEAAGEAIFAALFDSAPALQSLFKTPRAVMGLRLMNGFTFIMSNLKDPKALKLAVETLGFQHMDSEGTSPRVITFRNAMVNMLEVEASQHVTPKGKDGFMTLYNYVGGAFVYVRAKYAERLRLIQSGWAQVNNRHDEGKEAPKADVEGEEAAKEGEQSGANGSAEAPAAATAGPDESKKKKKAGWFGGWKKSSSGDKKSGSGKGGGSGEASGDFSNTLVPTTYKDMFVFNSVVMGLSHHTWMNEVSDSFDNIVLNSSNTFRLQEECDVLSLRMAKCKGTINLPQYKSVMLASLRSLVTDWGSDHEVAWSWLWENVEQMLQASLGRPAAQEKVLKALIGRFEEKELNIMRRGVFTKFFALAPSGQDFFKQSTTRLHFIADKIVGMTLDIYKDPKKMSEDISALGLRHVGYAIPTELFGPFVTACIQVVRMLPNDPVAEEGFRWSLGLISTRPFL